MLYKLLAHSDSSRFRYVVVSMLDENVLGSKIAALGIPVYALHMGRGRPNPLAIMKLVHILRREKPDILQTWLYHADLLGLFCGRLVGITRVIWNVRSSFLDIRASSTRSAIVLRMLSVLSRFATVVVANSKAGKDFHRAIGYRPARWDVIPNGFDLTTYRTDSAARIQFRKTIGLDDDAILIGMIASYDPIKDHANYLSAARLLLNIYPTVAVVFVGRGLDSNNVELMDAIKGKQLGQVIHLLGERDDIPSIMASLDILVSSSRGEGFSNAIGEAMACGVPCAVTDVGDSRWIVGNSGYVVPPQDPAALAHALQSLIKMGRKDRGALGLKARRRIEEEFDIAAVVDRYEQLYAKWVSN